MRMIIHRAFTREVLHACGAVSVILLAIFLVTRLVGFLRQAADGELPINSVLLLLLLKMITYLDIIVPLTLYISTLLVMARWSRDNELTVLNACGFGLLQLLKPAMRLVAMVGAPALLFSLYLTPLSIEATRAISHQLRAHANLSNLQPGVFTEIRDRNRVYFIESHNPNSDTFRNLFLYTGNNNDGNAGHAAQHEVVVAEVGRKVMDDRHADINDRAHFLVLQNGRRYRATAGVAEYAMLDFQTYRLRLKAQPGGGRSLPLKAMPTRALLGEPRAAAIGEFHWRLAKVIMLPILMLFALAFSAHSYRSTRFPGLAPALLVYFAYANALGLGVALIGRGALAPHWTLYMIHLIFLGLAVHLLHRRNRTQRLLPGRAT